MKLALLVLAALPALAGDFPGRLDLTLRRIMVGSSPRYDDNFLIADAVPSPDRRFTNFSGDLSGRYLEALSAVAVVQRRYNPALERLLKKLYSLQKPDGHFGAPLSPSGATDGDMAILWGNGRLMIGLMQYHQLTKSPDALEAARKLGGFLVKNGPRFNADAVRQEYSGEKYAVGYICWTSNIEGLVDLYLVTKDEKFLALAKEMAARVSRHESQHSHGFLSSVRGIVDLYRATNDKQYLEQVKKEWQGVLDSGNVLLQGAVPEMFAPKIQRDEGCSEADWLRLNLELWQITEDQQYLRQAELTLFNEFAFNQFASGDFGHHTLTESGAWVPTARAWWCCTLHGLRALAELSRFAFRAKDGDVYLDLPIQGVIDTGALAFRNFVAFERNGLVRIEVVKADDKPHTLHVFHPAWVKSATAKIGTVKVDGEVRDGYLALTRTWSKGEYLDVTYTLRTRLVRHKEQANRVAIFHGPWLLAVDDDANPNFFDEPSSLNRVLLPPPEGDEIKLPSAPFSRGFENRFAIPPARFQVRYLPGGYAVQYATALLRPIAEFTALPDSTRMDWWMTLAEAPPKPPPAKPAAGAVRPAPGSRAPVAPTPAPRAKPAPK